MYAVYGKRARLNKLTKIGRSYEAEFSMGRGFQEQEYFRSTPYQGGRGQRFFAVDDTWEDYKKKREERRARYRQSTAINDDFKDKLEPMGLEVRVYDHQIQIDGDYEKFSALLDLIGTQPPSALDDLI